MSLPKILITLVADEYLEKMLKETNAGFDSGRVKKTELLSWIITRFYKDSFAKQIKAIRADHFDEVAHLKAIIKQVEAAKKNDEKLQLGKLLEPLKAREKKPQADKPTPTPDE